MTIGETHPKRRLPIRTLRQVVDFLPVPELCFKDHLIKYESAILSYRTP